jgi:hypothetical protein
VIDQQPRRVRFYVDDGYPESRDYDDNHLEVEVPGSLRTGLPRPPQVPPPREPDPSAKGAGNLPA